jgi:hypothetical protein
MTSLAHDSDELLCKSMTAWQVTIRISMFYRNRAGICVILPTFSRIPGGGSDAGLGTRRRGRINPDSQPTEPKYVGYLAGGELLTSARSRSRIYNLDEGNFQPELCLGREENLRVAMDGARYAVDTGVVSPTDRHEYSSFSGMQ